MPLRIGKLASLTGRSVHTIRWYESQRLIPGVRRDLQGRRIYNEQHVEWLALLDRLRRSGMSIREQRMAELGQALEVIDGKIEFYGKWLRTGVQPPLPRIQNGSKQS